MEIIFMGKLTVLIVNVTTYLFGNLVIKQTVSAFIS